MPLVPAPLQTAVARAPAGGKAYWLHTSDGIRLRLGLWRAKTEPAHGTAFVFPGRSEYVEKYGITAGILTAAGYSVVVIDWRGQGLADRLTGDRSMGHIERFSDYQIDVAAFLETAAQLNLPKPWHLFAHSKGASIALRAAQTHLPFVSFAFTSPMWRLQLAPHKRIVAWPLAWAYHATQRGATYAPGADAQSSVLRTPFAGNSITSDPLMYEYFQEQAYLLPDYQIGGPSMEWLYQSLLDGCSLKSLPSPNVPCLTFCGSDDRLVDLRAIKTRMATWSRGSLVVVENGKHDLLSEIPSVRDGVYRSILDFWANQSRTTR